MNSISFSQWSLSSGLLRENRRDSCEESPGIGGAMEARKRNGAKPNGKEGTVATEAVALSLGTNMM